MNKEMLEEFYDERVVSLVKAINKSLITELTIRGGRPLKEILSLAYAKTKDNTSFMALLQDNYHGTIITQASVDSTSTDITEDEIKRNIKDLNDLLYNSIINYMMFFKSFDEPVVTNDGRRINNLTLEDMFNSILNKEKDG